ncbi:MAG: hypothetical protein DLM57_06625 [Pseudonocardiales bacterium]|nr:MAG: hypothetical protein DLM57_06625 [Pseudonocardiales bacterium]
MTRRHAVLLGILTSTMALAGGLAPASGLSVGYKAIASSAASGVQAGHTGYGPGWIALTFDTAGAPHGPITGYLFHSGVAGAAGNDHFDVSSYRTQPAASVNTPFAAGYAYGNFGGCTWSYLDSNGAELYGEGPLHTGGCTPPNHTTKIFCYDQAADPLCNAGNTSTEFEAGVWKSAHSHPARINPGGCDVIANVGAGAIYNGAAAVPANLIAHVNSGTVYVRYVTKRREYVMALEAGDLSPQLPSGIHWGFFPRGCLTPA